MLVFRIVLTKYANGLTASGRAARWNSNDIKVIYSSSSQALACLENVVHRSKLGLSANFVSLTIEIPKEVKIQSITLKELPLNWNDFENMHLTQAIGNKWVEENKCAVLQISSSIIKTEFNYLINPNHSDFKKIKLIDITPFAFDDRIKQ